MISSALKHCVWSGSAVVFLFCETSTGIVFSQEPAKSDRKGDRPAVSSDLESIYLKTENASTVADYTAILAFCRNVAGDTTRSREDREYARNLMSWAANRRGEARSDQAGIMVREQQLSEAEQLDALARKDFENAIQLDNTRWRAHHNLAITQAVQGEMQAALTSLAQVIRLNPEYPNAYFNRGEILFRANQYEAALADYEKGIQLAPDDASAFSGRAHTLYAMGKTKEALADYAKAMELAPQSVDAATEYADTCQALGNWKEAALAYQKAMQLDGKNARALQNAAWMMATCPDDFYRNGSSALETAQLAVQVASAPASAQVLDVLAAAQATAGDFAAAQNTVAEALRSTTDPVLRSELQMRGKLYQRKKGYVQPKR
ncbi:MAG: tetratricopeptide repeat protein [Pirellula staleyi]